MSSMPSDAADTTLASTTGMAGLEKDIDEAFIERLHLIAERVGSVGALARRAGISHSGFSRYTAGGEPSRKVLMALARAADVDLAWLATGRGAMLAQDKAGAFLGEGAATLTWLPFYDSPASAHDEVAPGAGGKPDFTAQAFCRNWLNSHGLDSTHLVAMQVRGDSMTPTLRSGDMVVIDTKARSVEDDRIYLLRDSGNLLLRRLQVEVGGRLRALADNPSHREFFVAAAAAELVGRVVWHGALL
jgi:phage repressor protein C with HTH and peptisase S24 domain